MGRAVGRAGCALGLGKIDLAAHCRASRTSGRRGGLCRRDADFRPAAGGEDILLVSLGTGTPTNEHAIDVEAARGWGRIGWVRPLIDVIFDGVSDTVEYELGQSPKGPQATNVRVV